MRRTPPDTPEARAHASECESIEEKLRTYCAEKGVQEVFDRTRTGRRGDYEQHALRVVPTADATGRVHMTIDQFAELVGVSRDELRAPDLPLFSLLDED